MNPTNPTQVPHDIYVGSGKTPEVTFHEISFPCKKFEISAHSARVPSFLRSCFAAIGSAELKTKSLLTTTVSALVAFTTHLAGIFGLSGHSRNHPTRARFVC